MKHQHQHSYENVNAPYSEIPNSRYNQGNYLKKETFSYDPKVGNQKTGKYNYHFSNVNDDAMDPTVDRGKKKFPSQKTEIKEANIFYTPDDLMNKLSARETEKYYFDRNLDTQDIPGSQPGTLQSKVVKNKEMAQKITGFRQKIVNPKEAVRDSLDVFQKNFEDYNNGIPNEIFDENAFSNDNKVGLGIKEASYFEDHNKNEENFQRSFSHDKPTIQHHPKNHENEAQEEDYEKFKTNFSNFYRGYTPDDFSKRKYPQAKRILLAYENIKTDLAKLEKEKERRIKEDPAFEKNIQKFFGIDENLQKPLKKKKKEKSVPKYQQEKDEKNEVIVLKKEIEETEERLRNLYLKQNFTGKDEKPKVPKQINPTYLSYAGSEISYGIKNDMKKYEVDVIGNILKKNEELDQSFHTIDGIKRFGAGLKNLNSETTLNPIPKKYLSKYIS